MGKLEEIIANIFELDPSQIKKEMTPADIETWDSLSQLGLQISKLEKSGSEECGWIKFYFIKNHGIIELNLLKKDV